MQSAADQTGSSTHRIYQNAKRKKVCWHGIRHRRIHASLVANVISKALQLALSFKQERQLQPQGEPNGQPKNPVLIPVENPKAFLNPTQSANLLSNPSQALKP